MLKSEETIFYSIESTIKAYRKLAQTKVNNINSKLTLDQSMVLKKLIEDPDITQMKLAKLIFKDYASVTRMIQLLVNNGFINREVNQENRRRNIIEVTKKTKVLMDEISKSVEINRKAAINNISIKDLNICKNTLEKIKNNIINIER